MAGWQQKQGSEGVVFIEYAGPTLDCSGLQGLVTTLPKKPIQILLGQEINKSNLFLKMPLSQVAKETVRPQVQPKIWELRQLLVRKYSEKVSKVRQALQSVSSSLGLQLPGLSFL